MEFLRQELSLVGPRMADDGIVVVDDIDWSNAFSSSVVPVAVRLADYHRGDDDRDGALPDGHPQRG